MSPKAWLKRIATERAKIFCWWFSLQRSIRLICHKIPVITSTTNAHHLCN